MAVPLEGELEIETREPIRHIESTLRPFINVPLDDAKNQIRLLELQPGIGVEELVGKLSMHPRSSPPEFEAISYTWGDRELSQRMTLNNTNFAITFNSWTALKQVRLPRSSRLVWIDSICINQNNDDEKSLQVQGIESVFRSASTTLISLDGAGSDSRFLFEWIREFSAIHSNPQSRGSGSAQQLYRACEHSYDFQRENKANYGRWAVAFKDWYLGLATKDIRRFFDALKAFGSCSYWRRLWVYPELVMSSKSTMFYGSSMCAMRLWCMFFSVITTLDTVSFRFDLAMAISAASEAMSRSYVTPIVEWRIAIDPVVRLLENVQKARESTVPGVSMYDLNVMQCTIAQDRIFALIPLIDWQRWGSSPILVDYKKSKIDLALECLAFCNDIFDVRYMLRALEVGCQHRDSNVANLLQRRHEIARTTHENYETSRDCRCDSPKFVRHVRFKGLTKGIHFKLGTHGYDRLIAGEEDQWTEGEEPPEWIEDEEPPEWIEDEEPPEWIKSEELPEWIKALKGEELPEWIKGEELLEWIEGEELPEWTTGIPRTPPFVYEESEAYVRMCSSGYRPVYEPPSHRYRFTYRIVAAVPTQASAGDFVYLMDSEGRTRDSSLCEALVVRHKGHGIYRIIGYAVVRPDERLRRRNDYSASFEPRFDAEDALAFGIQSLCLSSHCPEYSSLSSEMQQSPWCLLAAAPTRTAYSSYIVEESRGLRHGDAGGTVCSACGGFLEENYQEKNKQVAEWPLKHFSGTFIENNEVFSLQCWDPKLISR